MRNFPCNFCEPSWNFYVLWLLLSAIDFLEMTAEANIFDDIMAQVNDAIQNITNTGEDAAIDVENDVGKLSDISVDDKEVVFKYYNKDYPAGEAFTILEFDKSKLKGWRPETPLKVITHGWLSSEQSESVVSIKDAYLEKHDFNLITVDWSGPANNYIYSIPASKTTGVGQIIARLLNILVKLMLVVWENIHIIGHSLGGHAMGAAGGNTEEKVARISALDVAGPIFNEIDRPNIRVLDSTDALFVDVIHTAGGESGFGPDSSRGHVDFYPNGGTHPQPGCPETLGTSCSHGRSYLFFAESIMNPTAFIGKRCNNWDAFKKGDCDDNESQVMGDPTPNTATGDYYLATNDKPPFGKGL